MIFTSFINIYLVVVAIVNFILAFLIYFQSSKTRVNRFYSLTVLSATIWTFCMIMLRTVAQDDLALLYLWSTLLWVATIPIVLFYLYFCMEFPKELSSKKKWSIRLVLLVPALLVLFINILYFGTFKEVFIIDGGVGYELNLLHFYIWALYIIGYFSASFVLLFKKIKKAKGIIRVQLNYVIYGTLLAALFGVIFGIILPLFNSYRYFWLSEGAIIIMSILIAFAIFKHHLMNIKVITTEIFSVLIVIISLINALLSQSRTEFFLKFGLFVAIAIFSVLLIRGVLNEVRSREKVTKMARSLKRANIELQKLDKAKSEFISIASHQLRTPVSVIKGVASMMIEGDLDKFPVEKKERFIKSLWEKSCKLENIIDDILNATEMSNSKYKIKEEKAELINSEELIEKIIKDFQPITQERGISLFLKKSFKKSPKIYGQRQYLQEALSNLIDNAIKYTPSLGMDSEARGKRNKKGIISISITKKENN
ncbi:hypothetical protein KKA69_05780, partial [Patescibacteria group bacterium]|nr:hypothetical protein [Patescibacteria group bacterium]